jgi:hypothetical protein
MSNLMIFRKKSIPSDTQYGDDVGVVSAGKSIVSENLSEQILEGKLTYITSSEFSEGSTRVYLNGIYMTRGQDYDEVNHNKVVFINEISERFVSKDVSTLSIVYSTK